MDVHATYGDDGMLRRIIARLVALAVVAERAAGRCWPVRLFILFLLRRAEARMADFVLEETGMPVVFEDDAPTGNSAEDALCIAWRLRALAAALAALLPDACLIDDRPARPVFLSGAIGRLRGHLLAGWTPRPIDSS